jgi:FlaA1/EpsC-like NDP-sugar epimerase
MKQSSIGGLVEQQLDSSSTVLIVGGTGSIGSVLTRKFLERGVKEVRVFARDETPHLQLIDSLGQPSNLVSIIGDVRDKGSLDEAMKNVDVVVNAAAMKHVKFCEAFPYETFKTNVIGTKNLISLCLQKNIKQFVLTSSDKAATPSNVYGSSKLMAERIVISSAKQHPGYHFTVVRFGNVLDTRNSVLPRLRQLFESGMPIPIENSYMTRYIMTQSQAADLVIEALQLGQGGEIFTRDMSSVRVQELIHTYLTRYARSKKIDPNLFEIIEYAVGQTENAHESLFSPQELSRVRRREQTLIILPNNNNNVGESLTPEFPISSERALKLSVNEIDSLLEAANL